MFKMSPEVKALFRPLKALGIISIDFDAYYYCSILGMARLKKYDAKNEPEFYRNVPDNYSKDGKYKELILTMINAEVKYTGSDISNRDDIKNICNLLLDSTSTTNLTNNGADVLNSYCMGGYRELIRNNINMSEPRIFFKEYYDLVNYEKL